MDDDIRELVREGRRDAAIARLLPMYRDKVFALVFGIVGQRAAAEDIAQEVFVKIWRALPNFDGRAQLSTWIYAIARNAAVSALRSRRPAASLSDEAVVDQAEREHAARGEPGSSGTPAPDAAAEQALDTERLQGWIARLPDNQQRVVRLYYLREHGVEEVATMLGIPVGTVKTLLFRGREQLRRLALGDNAVGAKA